MTNPTRSPSNFRTIFEKVANTLESKPMTEPETSRHRTMSREASLWELTFSWDGRATITAAEKTASAAHAAMPATARRNWATRVRYRRLERSTPVWAT